MEYRNPVYSRSDNSAIDMEIDHPDFGWIPFTADPADTEALGKVMYGLAVAGTVASYIPPTDEQRRSGMPPLSARQLRLGLVDNGFTPAQVGQAIAEMPEGMEREKALIEWEYATEFDRMHPLIAAIGDVLDLSPEAVDAMWQQASAL